MLFLSTKLMSFVLVREDFLFKWNNLTLATERRIIENKKRKILFRFRWLFRTTEREYEFFLVQFHTLYKILIINGIEIDVEKPITYVEGERSQTKYIFI